MKFGVKNKAETLRKNISFCSVNRPGLVLIGPFLLKRNGSWFKDPAGRDETSLRSGRRSIAPDGLLSLRYLLLNLSGRHLRRADWSPSLTKAVNSP